VDRLAVAIAVDQVERRAADPLDRRKMQFHRPWPRLDRLRPKFQRARIRLVRIAHPKPHAARRRSVLGGEIPGEALRLAVDDEVDLALPVERDVLRAMIRDPLEAE